MDKDQLYVLYVKHFLKDNPNQVRQDAPNMSTRWLQASTPEPFPLRACPGISFTCSLVEAVKKTWWCVTRVAVIKGLCEEKEGEGGGG